jgi:SanA protein
MIPFRAILKYALIFGLIAILSVLVLHVYIIQSSKKFTSNSVSKVPYAYTALVLGAHVSKSGVPSGFLKDRLDMALELYKKKKVKKLLLSGDHGTVIYDEVNNMRDYLLERGVPTEDIFLDHAGFDTYNSVVRAENIFEVHDMLIVTQRFHLPRALYIARNKNIKAYGIVADKSNYGSLKYLKFRETIAGIKAFFEVMINKEPRFMGEKIPITGDSRKSYDR